MFDSTMNLLAVLGLGLASTELMILDTPPQMAMHADDSSGEQDPALGSVIHPDG